MRPGISQELLPAGSTKITVLCCAVQSYVRVNQWVFWTAWALAIAMILVLSCVEKARRSFPTNMILLGAFTCVQAFLVGTLTAFYNIEAVAIAFAVTAAAVVGITIFAINTKIDVTKWGTMLLVALIAFIVLLIIGMFWRTKLLYLIISGIACLLFSAYLVSATRWSQHGPSSSALLCNLTVANR
jgi:FtsH-binding integral membrane protein